MVNSPDLILELKKLKLELNAARAIAPEPQSSHPADISNAFRISAGVVAQRLVDVQGVPAAIEALESQLIQKRSQLKELEQQHQK